MEIVTHYCDICKRKVDDLFPVHIPAFGIIDKTSLYYDADVITVEFCSKCLAKVFESIYTDEMLAILLSFSR